MSNSLSIAAVTAALRTLLFSHLHVDTPDVSVTTLPLDKARGRDATNHQLNLFLFQVGHNASLRNMDFPQRTKSGESGLPPLALRLAYLLTPYAPADDDVESHKLLGKAMNVLHDHPLLGSEELRTALPGNDLHLQAERVRITPDTLTMEDLSKLWTTFQTQYRVSVVYLVSVVLIESTRPWRTPLPVLRPVLEVQPNLVPPYPMLDALTPPLLQASARLGDTLVLTGANLAGPSVGVRFSHPLWREPVTRPAADVTASQLTVSIPADAAAWPAGTYAVSAVITGADGTEHITPALPLTLAPRITSLTPNPVARGPGDEVTLTVAFEPRARPEQRVALLLGGRELPAPARATAVDSIAFTALGVPAGDHFVRLRVDGVDSLLIDRSVTPPVFDPTQRVTVT
ncbi:DUF4255 domain-containing protein [Corallococcus exiguus]|uniref:DUF4255 domain-containing protein n=1 Tax=Corallococcus exiguus TaxID=83462 RepID=UPI001494CC40|nr:DUF4255 domain-containing protein [Corallococcus exiguus]